MVLRDDLILYLDQMLQSSQFQDYCPNGLQVYGQNQVNKIATCPSVSFAFFQKALDQKADTLLVHHGLFWEGSTRVIEPYTGNRLRLLLENQINLIAYHLPLDAHPELGNNACLAELFGLTTCDFQFGAYRGVPIGVMGQLSQAASLQALAEIASTRLQCKPVCIENTHKPITSIAIMAGEGGNTQLVLEAKRLGVELLISGTLKESSVSVCNEIGLSAMALGHYNSEKLGVQALGDRIASTYRIEVVHLDVENPV